MKSSRFFVPLLFLSLLFLTACSISLAEDITPPPGAQQMPTTRTEAAPVSGSLYPLVAPDPANGAPIYVEKCAPCHGASGLGDGPQAAELPNPVAPLGSPELARQSTPADWYMQVTQGNLDRFMPPFNSLSDRQRWDVVAYAYSLSLTDSALQQGEELYQANCAGCHGENGEGNGPDAAGLASSPTDFTDQSWMAQKTGTDFFQAISEGVAPDMPAFAGQLSEEERWALSDYLRTVSFTALDEPVASSAGVEGAQALESTPEPQAAGSGPGSAGTSGEPADGGEAVAAAEAEASASVGTITGQVTNGSGGEVPAGLQITLHGFDEMQSVITDTAQLQEDGTYSFKNVEMPPGRAFLVAVDYGPATYGSEVAVVEQDMKTLALPVTVYETTTDVSVLTGDRLHLFFEFLDEETVRVIELYIMSNPSDKTLVAAEEGQPSITFELPQGATNLEFQDGVLGDRFVETPGGFGDTLAVRPGSGTYQVLFAFELPYDRKLEFVQPIAVPVSAVVALAPEGSVKIRSEMLQDAGVRDVQGTRYHTYNGGELSRGQDLRLTITGRPASGNPTLSAGSSANLIVGLGAFGLALILAGVWLYRRTRSKAVEEEQGESLQEPDVMAEESAETVMDAVLALDDLYQAGELPEEAYLQRRAELKARLKELIG